MTNATYSQLKTKIENDLDLIDEDFVTEAELLGYFNEAIKDAEAVVHNLGLEARYFLTNDTMSLVSGTADYDPPSDIYATKFVNVFYDNGSLKYPVERIRDFKDIPYIQTGEDYRYIIFNLTAGPKMRFYPTPAESGAYVPRYYIREVRQLTTSTSASNTLEIPEAQNFILQHAKLRIYEKERISPNIEKAMMDLKTQHDLMVQTLQEMVPDNNNKILPDYSFYNDDAADFLRGSY